MGGGLIKRGSLVGMGYHHYLMTSGRTAVSSLYWVESNSAENSFGTCSSVPVMHNNSNGDC